MKAVIYISMKLTIEQELELCQLYGKISKTELMRKFSLTNAPIIYRILRRHNVEVKTKSDANIWKREIRMFDKITEEWQAYFLGLLFSDGNLYKNRVSISLVEDDFYIVEKICSKLFVNPPKYYKSIHKITNKEGNKIECRPQLCISFSNVKFANILREKFNLQSKKSLTCQFPKNIPCQFLNHFIRGYFDGDGCIKHNGTARTISILGSLPFLEAVKSILLLEGLEKVFIKQRGNIHSIYIYSKNDIDKFYEFLYKDATLFLERKHKKFVFSLHLVSC